MGRDHAPLIALAYLTLVESGDLEDVIRLILRGRPAAVPAWETYRGCREDRVDAHREAIARRAYELYREGVHADALRDWCRAEAETLRSILAG